jgi:hypothetical protein
MLDSSHKLIAKSPGCFERKQCTFHFAIKSKNHSTSDVTGLKFRLPTGIAGWKSEFFNAIQLCGPSISKLKHRKG